MCVSCFAVALRRGYIRTVYRVNCGLVVVRIEVRQCLAYDYCELDLVVKIDALWSMDWAGAWKEDCTWWLEEEEWLLRSLIVELFDVVAV